MSSISRNGLINSDKVRLALGLGLVGALALTACGGDDTQGTEEPGEVQGETGEAADPGTQGTGEETQESVAQEAPLLSEIQDQVTQTLHEAESVTITASGSVPGLADEGSDSDTEDPDLDEAEDAEDLDDEAEEQLENAEDLQMVYRGAGDGSLAMAEVSAEGVQMSVVTVDNAAYFSGDSLLSIFESQLPQDQLEQFDLESLREDLDGRWIDTGQEDDLGSLADVLDEIDEDEWTDEFSEEGTVEERDGQTVWVYSGADSSELVIVADEESPYLHSMTQGTDGDDLSIIFSDWDSTELPEEPAEEDIISEEEFQQLMMQRLQ